MEREFKFRAWIELGDNSEIKAMLEDIAIYTQSHNGNCGMSMDEFIEAIKEQTGYEYNDGQFVYNRPDGTPDRDAIDAEEFNVYEMEEWFLFDGEIMQYVGLKDKNGTPIFEGDIVNTGTNKAMVIGWSERFASFVIMRDGWAFQHWFGEAMEGSDCEVIGNIYQNPELINKATS